MTDQEFREIMEQSGARGSCCGSGEIGHCSCKPDCPCSCQSCSC